MKDKESKMPSESHRLQWSVPAEQFPEFYAAMERYEFEKNSDFVAACVSALIRAHKAEHTLSRPLKFQPVIERPSE